MKLKIDLCQLHELFRQLNLNSQVLNLSFATYIERFREISTKRSDFVTWVLYFKTDQIKSS